MVERKPFDPANPIDAMAESFRRQVLDMAIEAEKAAIYRDLAPMDQFRAFAAGVATGLVCVAFAHIRPEGRDEIMGALSEFLAYGRVQAESIERIPTEAPTG